MFGRAEGVIGILSQVVNWLHLGCLAERHSDHQRSRRAGLDELPASIHMLDGTDAKYGFSGDRHRVAASGVLHFLQGREIGVGSVIPAMGGLGPVDRTVKLDQRDVTWTRRAAQTEGHVERARIVLCKHVPVARDDDVPGLDDFADLRPPATRNLKISRSFTEDTRNDKAKIG
jgi:hypothetical protein